MKASIPTAAVLAGGAVLLAAGIATGLLLSRLRAPSPAAAAAPPVAEKSAPPKPLYWYDPMRPDQHFSKPGKSPFMDMELVPKYPEPVGGSVGQSEGAGTRQGLGIRTVEVTHAALAGGVRAPATLGWNLRDEVVVSSRAEGTVARLAVKAPFERIQRGQVLATLRAPAWAAAAAEARALARSGSPLAEAARQRLATLGFDAGSLASDGSVILRAPRAGVVSEILVREGQAVAAGTALFRINGIDTLWLEAQVPEAQAGIVVPGAAVTATVASAPGRRFEGTVEALLPQVDAATRTRVARIVVANPDGTLVPGMYADATIATGDAAHVLVVPSEAVIATGNDMRVIVQDAEGDFTPVRVQVGRSAGGQTEILSGLQHGQRVVASGQFLLDSEASLSGALDRLSAEPSP